MSQANRDGSARNLADQPEGVLRAKAAPECLRYSQAGFAASTASALSQLPGAGQKNSCKGRTR